MIPARSGPRRSLAPPGCGASAATRDSTTTNASGTVRCEISVKTWTPPPQPATCGVDWGQGLTLQGQAEMLCAGDTIRGLTSPLLLPYGTSIRFTPFTCTSQPTGIDCVNTVTRAGFLISRERYELRNP